MTADRSMENGTIDSILENLFHILPIIHKKLLRMDLGGVTGNLSRLHLAIMEMLRGENLAVSEVAKRLLISKSQMTHLIDQLVDLDIVARHHDAKDRRVINISLTNHGKAMLKECRGIMKQTIRNKLSNLTRAELAELSMALEKLNDIGAKLE
jgi:DNA-binding MarR family transcriptional regulator